MNKLNLPEFKFGFTIKNGKKYIYDIIRKKYLILKPEEWVRQNIIRYFIEYLNFPIGFVAQEYLLKSGSVTKSCDIVVFNKEHKPLLIVECKSPNIKISQSTFDQIAIYNSLLNVKYLLITNGINHIICEVDSINKKLIFLEEIPDYSSLL